MRVVVAHAGSTAGWPVARAAPAVVLVVSRRAAPDNHFSRFAVGNLEPVFLVGSRRGCIRPKFDDEVIILLSSSSFAIILGGLLELDPLKGVLRLRCIDIGIRDDPAVRVRT